MNPSTYKVQPKIIEDVNIHSLGGCEKNISGFIFSPGLQERPKTTGANANPLRKSMALPKTSPLDKSTLSVASAVKSKKALD